MYSNFGGVFYVFSLYDKLIEYIENVIIISVEIGNKSLEGDLYREFG